MNEGQELERIQTEEASLNSNSDFAILRKLNRNKDDPQEKLRTDGYLRAVEDSVEQNDNSFDGIINNTVQDEKSDDLKESENKRESLIDEIRKEREKSVQTTEKASHKPVPRVLYTDGEERIL